MKIWRFLVGGFAVVGLLSVLLMIVVMVAVSRLAGLAGAPVEPPETIVLRLDLREWPPDRSPTASPFGQFDGPTTTLRELVLALDRGRDDPRVAGLVGHFDSEVFNLATAQELRDAVRRFRDSGKFAIAYADTLGEGGPANAAYYLASSFDEVWMLPLGTIGLSGFYAEVPFAQEGLQELGVEAEFARRGPYKSFSEVFTERDFTPAHREMMESIVGDLYDQLVAGIAEHRDLDEGAVRALIDGGPYSAVEAESLGLIDRLAGRRAIRTEIEARAGSLADTMDAGDYLAVAPAPAGDDQRRIALVYATGPIMLGGNGQSPFGDGQMAADTIAGALNQAIDDDTVEAIVMRVDSPGGSAVASEVIGRVVRRAEEEGKPLIVSMGGVAASGGYWISAGATAIVAQPGTQTGSIGVLAGKFATENLWDDLGVNWSPVQRGANADMWSGTRPFSARAEARLEAMVEDIYSQFLDRVSAGRSLPRDAVHAVAQGRVWTGAQAQERGLVDRLGGLDTALLMAKESAGMPLDAEAELLILPRRLTPFEQILDLAGGGGLRQARQAEALLQRLDPYLRHLEPLIREPGENLLRMPELGIR